MVEWSRALDVRRLSEWCCSVSMVWVQIPSREEQEFDSSNTVWFNFQTYIYIYTYILTGYFCELFSNSMISLLLDIYSSMYIEGNGFFLLLSHEF